MTNMTGSKLSICSHPGKITSYWITTRSFPYWGPYWRPGPIWASIWKWSCNNPITGYFPGVWKYGQFWSYKNAFIWTKYVINTKKKTSLIIFKILLASIFLQLKMNFLWPVLSLLIAINDVHVSIHIKYYYIFNIDKKKTFIKRHFWITVYKAKIQ